MRASILSVVMAIGLSQTAGIAQTRAGRTFDIYVVDVEGGNGVLFVAPSGESLLIDTGNAGTTRDVERILAAAKDAGITQIDNLITTHYHGDHVGGVVELANRIPVRRFIDHGPNVQPNANIDALLKQYADLYGKATHMVAKPGDKIPLAGLDARIVTSGGQALKTPLPGGGKPNPLCASFKPKDPDPTENAQSVGTVITYGKFRIVHLGDLTWNKESDLMCPTNPIGTADVLIVSHHGLNISNSEVLVHALRPRVAIMNNGIRKGGVPDTMKVLYSSPGLEDLWQIHFALLGGQEYAVPGLFIANTEAGPTVPLAPVTPPQPVAGQPPAPAPVHDGAAYWIKLSAQQDGTFTVTNGRNGFSKTYAAK